MTNHGLVSRAWVKEGKPGNIVDMKCNCHIYNYHAIIMPDNVDFKYNYHIIHNWQCQKIS